MLSLAAGEVVRSHPWAIQRFFCGMQQWLRYSCRNTRDPKKIYKEFQ